MMFVHRCKYNPVTAYSFTVPALKLMKVKLCLFLATTAHCHDGLRLKFISLILIVFLMIDLILTAQLIVVYKIPYRRARAWPRPSARASKGILHTKLIASRDCFEIC